MLCVKDSKREFSSYNHFSLVRESHHQGGYPTSGYKEGSFLLTTPKLRKKSYTDMVRVRMDSRQKTSCFGKYPNLRVGLVICAKSNSSNRFVNSN